MPSVAPFTPPPLLPHLAIIISLLTTQALVAVSSSSFLPSFAYFRDYILPGGTSTVKWTIVFAVLAHAAEAAWFWRFLGKKGVQAGDRNQWVIWTLLFGLLPMMPHYKNQRKLTSTKRSS